MRAVGIRISLLLLAGWISVACDSSSAEFPPVDAIEEVLSAAVSQGPGTVVALDTVIGGEWRFLYIIGPYTNPIAIRRCVGASVATRGIEVHDGFTLLVLEPVRGALRSVALPGRVAFAPEATNRIYPRGSASFAAQEAGPGLRRHLIPAGSRTRGCSEARRW